MKTVYILILVQGFMGAFDTFYFHEWKLKLPSQPICVREQWLHAVRDFLYGILYFQLGLGVVYGIWAWLILLLLFLEILITLADFLTEDMIRKVPPGERVLHSLVAILFGCVLAYYVPILLSNAQQKTEFLLKTNQFSWLFLIMGTGALGMGVRDYAAHVRLKNG